MVWVDNGKEFYNKDVQKLVALYSTESEEKSCVIERFNRTIKEKMFKYFSANNTRNISMYLTYFSNSIIKQFIRRLK